MNKVSSNNYDAELSSLISIIEQWNLVLNEMNDLHDDLSEIPFDLIALKQHQQDLSIKDIENSTISQANNLAKVDIQKVVKYLERASSRLIKLNVKTQNLIALRERVEAIQDNYKLVSTPDYNDEFLHFKKPVENAVVEENKFQLINKIKIFKRQYPENFWSIIIAFFLILIFGWKLTAPSPLELASPINSVEQSN